MLTTITLPTSTEARERLTKAGWTLEPRTRSGQPETWESPTGSCSVYLSPGELPRIYPQVDESEAIDLLPLLEFATLLGISPPGYRLVGAANLEHIQHLADEAADGLQHDPSWIRPRALSMAERAGRMKQVAIRLAALNPKEVKTT